MAFAFGNGSGSATPAAFSSGGGTAVGVAAPKITAGPITKIGSIGGSGGGGGMSRKPGLSKRPIGKPSRMSR